MSMFNKLSFFSKTIKKFLHFLVNSCILVDVRAPKLNSNLIGFKYGVTNIHVY